MEYGFVGDVNFIFEEISVKDSVYKYNTFETNFFAGTFAYDAF